MGNITELLHQWREGSRKAESELFALVAPDLRRLAHFMMQRERPGHTMQPTELVNEIYFRLVAAKDRDWRNRGHFFAIAAKAMRRHLIDHARGRPKAEIITLAGVENFVGTDSVKVELALTIDRLLDELAESEPKLGTIVELKFFLGLSDEETAEVLGLKLRTMQRMWRDARQWLFERMEPGDAWPNAER